MQESTFLLFENVILLFLFEIQLDKIKKVFDSKLTCLKIAQRLTYLLNLIIILQIVLVSITFWYSFS